MRTTIDGAGRLVVPKVLRDALGLSSGRAVDITLTDGRLEIEVPPVEVSVDVTERLPRLVAVGQDQPAVSDSQVRATLESTRQ